MSMLYTKCHAHNHQTIVGTVLSPLILNSQSKIKKNLKMFDLSPTNINNDVTA